MSVLARKPWKDVRRRWARSLFTSATIAAAVAGLSLFAVMSLLNQAMDRRVVDDRLHDIRFTTDDVVLSADELAALRALPGVVALDGRTVYPTRLHVGDRREDVLLVGVSDFHDQQVNVVNLDAGTAPGAGEVVSDSGNSRTGRLAGGRRTVVEVEDDSGQLHRLTVSATGATLEFTQLTTERAVLYGPQSTVDAIAGVTGINSIDVRVEDPTNAGAVVAEVREWFARQRPEVLFTNLPEVRKAGTWPGEEISGNFSSLFYVGGILALLSAIALVSNTMTTMVAEQRREIAIMKAIGGRRRQVMGLFLRTVLILAGTGTLFGVLIGIPFSNWVANFVGRQFLGVDTSWGLSLPVVILSVVVGIGGAAVAAIPALVRASRLPVREGLTQELSSTPGSWLDSLLRRAPLRRTVQVGLRNVSRRKTRTLATVVQVGLGAGVALGFLALGTTVADVTAKTWDTLHWDITIYQRSNTPLDAGAGDILTRLAGPGSHPILFNNVEVAGEQYEAWALPPDTPLYTPGILAGRWLSIEDGASRARVAVAGRALAAKAGLKVGQPVTVGTARGPVDVTIVGIDGRLLNNGTVLWMPLATMQDILQRKDTNAWWLQSPDRNHPAIDQLASRAEDALSAAGYPAGSRIRYVEREANLSSNRILVAVLAVMGIPIVAIGLIGLANMMTMNVLERTREVGILRCIGARSRDISAIFRTEAVITAFLGWLIAVPLGWLIGWTLTLIVVNLFDFGSVPYSYPAWYPPVALGGTILLALLVVIAPLRRASHLRPGDALRYE
jgi:putative ABC transport system permease protein